MNANFNSLSTKDKKELLCEFLREYAKWSLAEREKALKIVRFKGIEFAMSWKECASRAVDMLEINLIQSMKFECLVAGLKQNHLDHFYEHVMGQKIEEALVK